MSTWTKRPNLLGSLAAVAFAAALVPPGCTKKSDAPSSAKELTSFSFRATDNPGALSSDVAATIVGSAIGATVPFGTDRSALRASFATTGTRVTVAGTPQASGVTANDFSAPLTYRVLAPDGSTRDYAVSVVEAPSSAKELTAFSFLSARNGGVLAADVTATITGTGITATVPYGTDVTALVATFSTTGAGVTVSGAAQVSGATANDFTAPLTYRVTAADASTKDFTVTVTVAANPAKELTAFSFLSAQNGGVLAADVTASLAGTSLTATVPYGTNVTALVATFSATGASVSVSGAAQVSGTTANDFTAPLTYRVTAADGTTKDFTVTVTVAANPAKELTAFSFLSVNSGGVLTADVTATIAGTSVTATVPYGTNVTALVATFSTTGASVSVGGTAQASGVTANDFSAPVTYRVTAADATTRDFTVTVAFTFGSGSDGALAVTGSTSLAGGRASVAATAGSTNLTLSNVSGTFAAGMEVLLHQTQDAAGGAGGYEFARIASISGATVTLTAPIAGSYVTDATHRAQAIVVPQFTSVSVAVGGALTAPAWNGTTGGILVFDATGAVTVDGTLTMDAAGFRGTRHGACLTHCVPGQAGESPAGLGAVGVWANGSGGGGGAPGQDCGNGGGGAYGSAGVAGTAIVGGGICSTSPGARASPGSADGAANLSGTALFGGAGGEGGHDEDGGEAGVGGNGGGLVIVRAGAIAVSATGLVTSAGATGGDGDNVCGGGGGGMGGGGGGAGGAIRLQSAGGASLGSSRVVAPGGAGGMCSAAGYYAGAGGTGRIGVLAPGGVTGATSPAYDPE